MGYFDTLDPSGGKMLALGEALLGLGTGLAGQGATPYPQPFVSALARGAAGFGTGLNEGLLNMRRGRPAALGEQAPPSQPLEPNAAGVAAAGGAKEAPPSITAYNLVTIARRIVASGKPLWIQAPDGAIDQVTPGQARAWLEQLKVK
jgi:hypothetical protein